MEEQDKPHVHLSALISSARLKLGFSTLREFFRVKEPAIDYQAWLHVESGRRIPAPASLVVMGELLGIAREDLMIAYCKDKFADELSHQVLDALQAKSFFDVATLMNAKDHDRTKDYVFTAEQIKAMTDDLRIKLYLIYTYDRDRTTTISHLANFFGVEKQEALEVVDRLKSLGLVETIGEQVRKIYAHTTIPASADIFQLRKQFLLKGLDISLEPGCHISNYHVNLTEKSYKRILGMFDFVEANLTKMEKEDMNDPSSVRYQIAMAGTRLREEVSDRKKAETNS